MVGPSLYYLAVIDILQKWTARKKAERALKIIAFCRCADRDEMSAVEPETYYLRFQHMVERILKIDDPLKAPMERKPTRSLTRSSSRASNASDRPVQTAGEPMK